MDLQKAVPLAVCWERMMAPEKDCQLVLPWVVCLVRKTDWPSGCLRASSSVALKDLQWGYSLDQQD